MGFICMSALADLSGAVSLPPVESGHFDKIILTHSILNEKQFFPGFFYIF